jgi:hypothetical protein
MALTVLPSEEVRIGSRVLHEVSFLVPGSTGRRVIGAGEEGLLPTVLFKRVFISYTDHFVRYVMDSEIIPAIRPIFVIVFWF